MTDHDTHSFTQTHADAERKQAPRVNWKRGLLYLGAGISVLLIGQVVWASNFAKNAKPAADTQYSEKLYIITQSGHGVRAFHATGAEWEEYSSHE